MKLVDLLLYIFSLLFVACLIALYLFMFPNTLDNLAHSVEKVFVHEEKLPDKNRYSEWNWEEMTRTLTGKKPSQIIQILGSPDQIIKDPDGFFEAEWVYNNVNIMSGVEKAFVKKSVRLKFRGGKVYTCALGHSHFVGNARN